MRSEKRRCQRLKIEIPVSICANSQGASDPEPNAQFSVATALDLSGLGFRILTNESLVSGKEIFIRAHLANEILNLKAKVMWIHENNSPDGEKYLAGIKILDTPVHDESKFIKFFAKQLLELSKCKVIYPF